MTPVRLLLIQPSPAVGGGEEAVRLLAQHLDKQRLSVTVVCPPSPTADRLRAVPGVECVPFRFPTLPTPAVVAALAQVLHQRRPDIVHSQLFHGDLYAFLATRLAPVPVLVSTVQGVNFMWETERGNRRVRWRIASLFYRAIYRAFSGVAAPSVGVRDALASRPGIRVPSSNVRVIANAVDLSSMTRTAGAEAIPERAGTHRLVHVGNFFPVKGQAILVEALAHLRRELSVECLFVGDGPERGRIAQMVRARGLEDSVRFLGRRGDVMNLLATADAFPFPSLSEGIPIALLEAMAAGVPVVAARSGGIPEVVTDGRDGLLVTPGDAMALATAIRRVLLEPALSAHLVLNARQTIAERFEPFAMAQRYERWYAVLLGQAGRRPLWDFPAPEPI